jgi:acetyl-CoA carboxylase, biotin carboxylase subunit
MKHKILVANRGEIAVRIIRAAKEMGIPTVAVFSVADKDALHVKVADEAICIGEAPSKASYLNQTAILSAAVATGCTIIHPGYGFLSENADFADMVEGAGLTFVGPKAETLRLTGDKVRAIKAARSFHVPVSSGSDGVVSDINEGLAAARSIGYPVMIKARGGGGGRGIAVATSDEAFRRAFERTALEAAAGFSDSALYVESFVESPRHIEVQVLADKEGNVVHLGTRDCSVQRRNQKMIEESQAVLPEPVRRKIHMAALRMTKGIGYVGAGTLEFLLDGQGGIHFIEMNARLQVEHPVTEMTTSVDIVKEQIRIALGHPLSVKQRDIRHTGVAIECRVIAEDPDHMFRPSPGTVTNVVFPGGPGIRVDTHIYPTCVVPPHYDSLLAKVIAFAPTRLEAIRKMRVALEQFVVDGVKTNIEYLYLVMHNAEFIKGGVDTGFLSRFHALYEEARR